MNNTCHFEESEKVFKLLLEADNNLWKAVMIIQDSNAEDLYDLVDMMMTMRGNIHIDLMRPIYKIHPELAEHAGFGESEIEDGDSC